MERSIQRVGILDAGSDIHSDLQHWLLQRGYLVDVMQDAASMEVYCTQINPAAVIVDIGIGDQQGTELIGHLRGAGFESPIIATMAERDDLLQVQALQDGADDVLLRQGNTKTLLERLELILRQQSENSSGTTYSDSAALADVLTAMERRILKSLEDNMPDPQSRDQIMWAVKRQRISPDDRSIDVYISNIRRKLRLVQSPLVIETVRGVGFLLTRSSN